MKNNWNAYANESLRLEPTAAGPLSGLTFAVKDVFHIAGETAGAGNPDWLRTHGPASKHAAVIGRLLENGARMEGTTITDELMYSINGENVHYGTPRNPNAPGRIPGGSSSGSAVAAAAGLADFAVGTDTGGSVRVPASYCGVYGIRPSHGAISVEGLIPLAPSFDTVGWMARDPETMLRVGRALLPQSEAVTEQEQGHAPPAARHGFGRLLLARDMWALSDACTSDALSSCLPALRELILTVQDVEIAPEGFSVWMNAFRILQGSEIWEQHGGWLESVRPSFGPGIAERFRWTGTLGEDKRTAASLVRRKASRRMAELMDESTLIIAPTVPSIAPPLNGSGEAVERRRSQTLQLSCAAGLSGLPQVTLPLQGEGGMPIGLSFIAARGQDLRLLEWLAFVSSALPAHRFG